MYLVMKIINKFLIKCLKTNEKNTNSTKKTQENTFQKPAKGFYKISFVTKLIRSVFKCNILLVRK